MRLLETIFFIFLKTDKIIIKPIKFNYFIIYTFEVKFYKINQKTI